MRFKKLFGLPNVRSRLCLVSMRLAFLLVRSCCSLDEPLFLIISLPDSGDIFRTAVDNNKSNGDLPMEWATEESGSDRQ